MAGKFSKSGIILDIILFCKLVIQAFYMGFFRKAALDTVLLCMGTDFYYLTWATCGGFLIIVSVLLIGGFFDGDSTRRSWFAIFAMFVAGALYFALAIGASIGVYSLDNFSKRLTGHQYRVYKFLLSADYILAIFFVLHGVLRVMIRKRSGNGKS